MLTRLCAAAALLSLCFGCGDGDDGGDEPAAAGPCAAPSGFYEATTVLKSGTCGPQTDTVMDASKPGPATGSPQAGCQGEGSVSADGCKFQVHSTCPVTPTNREQAQITLYGGVPPTLTVTASTTYDRTADHGSGVWALSRTSPSSDSCSGTYEITLTRL